MYTSRSHKTRLDHIVYINKNCQTCRDDSIGRAKTEQCVLSHSHFTLSLAHADQRLLASEVAKVSQNLGDDTTTTTTTTFLNVKFRDSNFA